MKEELGRKSRGVVEVEDNKYADKKVGKEQKAGGEEKRREMEERRN